MLNRQILELFDVLDRPDANAAAVADVLGRRCGDMLSVAWEHVRGEAGGTDCICIRLAGLHGRSSGGGAPTLGIIGRLGGIGARPAAIGFVSDGDGALAALAAIMKLGEMSCMGDRIPGDVVVCTHIDPDAPVRPHRPVPFMGSAISGARTNLLEIVPEMEAIISIDTTKGNRLLNHRGIAITPTVLAGNLLPVSDDLMDLLCTVTGELPYILPLNQYDITPYGNGLLHVNSILQPSVATTVPVVGLAVTAQVPVAGCATGASHLADVELAARFCVEVAKRYGAGECPFFDEAQYAHYLELYGTGNTRFQTIPEN
ncbi:MAG: DUF1177 family protein [Sphaerochaetaceae bacterium]|nr:DUF1177 family protein [Sphaerochaetaceae bacterium]